MIYFLDSLLYGLFLSDIDKYATLALNFATAGVEFVILKYLNLFKSVCTDGYVKKQQNFLNNRSEYKK
jgi:hypothetical protein